jgi:hypothetical protein
VRELPTPKSFVSRKGAFGGYEVTGWRYAGDTAWHVKTRPKSQQQHETAYVVRDGAFDPDTAIPNEKVAILSLIAQWEAGLPDTVTDLLDFNNHD